MAGYIGKSQVVTQVNGYTQSEADSNFVDTSGDTMTGDLSFGDNDKAKFGASDDLQIYHDGSNSFITEDGTGHLYVQGTQLVLKGGSTPKKALYSDGVTTYLYSNDSIKLTTTSTGVVVAGTVDSDELTVSGNGDERSIGFNLYGASKYNLYMDGATDADKMHIRKGTTNVATFDTSGNVGIGTSSPVGKLHIENTVSNDGIRIISSNTGEGYLIFGDVADSNTGSIAYNHTSDAMTFDVNNAERMRIDNNGRVTMPYQPAFHAQLNSTVSWFNGTISFASDVMDIGNNHNNGVFTAPVSGTYFFAVNVVLTGGTTGQDDTMAWGFYKNGAQYQFLHDNWSYLMRNAGNGVDMISSQSAVIYLSANDTVAVRISGISHTGGQVRDSTSWSGYLIG